MQALQARSPVSPISTITVESTFKRLAEQPSHLARRCRGTAAHFHARLCKRHHRLRGDPTGYAPISRSSATQFRPDRGRHQGLLVRSSQAGALQNAHYVLTTRGASLAGGPGLPGGVGALLHLGSVQQPKRMRNIYYNNSSGRPPTASVT